MKLSEIKKGMKVFVYRNDAPDSPYVGEVVEPGPTTTKVKIPELPDPRAFLNGRLSPFKEQ